VLKVHAIYPFLGLKKKKKEKKEKKNPTWKRKQIGVGCRNLHFFPCSRAELPSEEKEKKIYWLDTYTSQADSLIK